MQPFGYRPGPGAGRAAGREGDGGGAGVDRCARRAVPVGTGEGEGPPGHRPLLAARPATAARACFIGDVEAAGTPIVLIHGVVDNRSIFTVLRRGLPKRGFGRVSALNYSLARPTTCATSPNGSQAPSRAVRRDRLRARPPDRSLHGRPRRSLLRPADGRRRAACTRSSPWVLRTAGRTPPGWCRTRWPASCGRRSTLIAELAEPAPDCTTRFVAFWSDLDQVVIPSSSARLEHPDLLARNVFISGVAHLSLPIDGRVVREIGATLAHLDADGSAIPANVTQLDDVRTPRPRAASRSAASASQLAQAAAGAARSGHRGAHLLLGWRRRRGRRGIGVQAVEDERRDPLPRVGRGTAMRWTRPALAISSRTRSCDTKSARSTPAAWARADQGHDSFVRARTQLLELAGRVRRRGDEQVGETAARRLQPQDVQHVATEAGPRVWVGEGSIDRCRVVGHAFGEDGVDELLPAREAPVERGIADAGAASDLIERRVEPALAEDLAGRRHERRAVSGGVGARSGSRRGRTSHQDRTSGEDPPVSVIVRSTTFLEEPAMRIQVLTGTTGRAASASGSQRGWSGSVGARRPRGGARRPARPPAALLRLRDVAGPRTARVRATRRSPASARPSTVPTATSS